MFKKRNKLGLMVLVCIIGVSQFFLHTPAFSGSVEVGLYVYSRTPMIYWDPREIIGDESIVYDFIVYETLLRYDPFKNEFEPILAESYEKSKDGKTWTFHLRKGVKFHTGNELDSKAVKFSIETTISGKKGVFYIWPEIESIETPDKYTVVFKLKHPTPLDIIVSAGYGALIFDPANADRDWFYEGHDSGTGPYVIERHKGGIEIVLGRFEDYWRGWKGKHFDKIVYKTVEESSTRSMMVESGNADFANRLPLSMIQAIEKNPEIEIVRTSSFQNLNVLFNMAKSEKYPISNPFVRKALACTMPYDDIVKGVLGGYGRQARGAIPSTMWGFSEGVKQYTFSPATAKYYLKRAGYPDGGIKLLLIYTAGDEQMRRVAELWKAELAKLNVELEVRGMPWDTQVEFGHKTNPDERQDIYMLYWWPDAPHPHTFVSAMYETLEPPIYNFSYYSNPAYDELINLANAMTGTDQKEAINMYAEAQNILMEDMVGVPIYEMEYARAKKKSLKGYVDNPAYPHVVFWYDCYREE